MMFERLRLLRSFGFVNEYSSLSRCEDGCCGRRIWAPPVRLRCFPWAADKQGFADPAGSECEVMYKLLQQFS